MRKGITKINAQNLLWVHRKSGRGVNNTDEVDHNRLMSGISKMGQKIHTCFRNLYANNQYVAV